jgi:Domain of unknown function (DUF4372)/Transposase DDE domain
MNQGKYILSPLLEVVNRYEFDKCVDRYNDNLYVKQFSCWEQFLVMSFAQFCGRESLRDITYCLRAFQSNLYHCGISSRRIARSTLAQANANRSWKIYADFAQSLIQTALPLYKGENRVAKKLRTVLYAFDSTTIDLCLQLFEWATFRSTKAGVKVHVLLNIEGAIPEFIRITEAISSDVKLLDELAYKAGCYYLLDRGYVAYERLYHIEQQKAFFVTRARENWACKVVSKRAADKNSGIQKDQSVQLKGYYAAKDYPVLLRRIEYKDQQTKKVLVFLTNNFVLKAATVARLYQQRWNVELFFKRIKQHLRIKRFYGNSDNAVRLQIWIAVCDYLLVAIIKKQMHIEASLSQMMQVLSLSLFEKVSINELFN